MRESLLAQILRSFESLLVRDVGRVSYRDLFRAYVEGQRAIRAHKDFKTQTFSAEVKHVGKTIDSMLLKGIFANYLKDPSSEKLLAHFPLYMLGPVSTMQVIPPPGSNPSLRKDVVVAADAFLRRNIAAPYLHSVRKAVALNYFASLHKELKELNNLRFILPFTTLHYCRRIESLGGEEVDQSTRVSAESAISALFLYLAATDDALKRMKVVESETHDFWYKTPPLSHMSFTQECDVLISLLSHRRDTTFGSAVPPVTTLVESVQQRIVLLAKFLAMRNLLKQTKEMALNTEAMAPPVVLATFEKEAVSNAFSLGIPTASLPRFASSQTTAILGGTLSPGSNEDRASVAKDCSGISKMLEQRERNFIQRTQPL